MMLRGSRPGSMGVDGAGVIGRLLATSLRASYGTIPSSLRKHRNHGRLREGTTSTSSPSSGFGRLPLLWAGSVRRACADVSCGSGVRESSAVAGDQGSGATADRFKLKDLEVPGTIRTGANSVGTQVLEAARRSLSELRDELNLSLDIFSFGFESSQGRVYVRLDKVDNKYGSPTLDDIEAFSRKYNAVLEEELGQEVSDDIEVEVSSPGAERALRVPEDLLRFSDLPIRVEAPKSAVNFDGIEIKKSKNDLHATIRLVATVTDVNREAGKVELTPFKSKRNEEAFGRKTWNKIFKSKQTLVLALDDLVGANLHLEI